MSGPVNPPLKITDTDGSPSIRPTREIILNSSDFTLTESSSGTASISVASGAGSSLTSTYVAFGSASNEITGSSKLTWTDTAGSESLRLTGSGTSNMLRLESTDAGADSAPDLILYRNSASPASNDVLGQIDFNGEDSGGSEVTYSFITSSIANSTSTTKASRFEIKNMHGNSLISWIKCYGEAGTDPQTPTGALVINEEAYRIDFRVKDEDNGINLCTSGSQKNVGVGAITTSGKAQLQVDADCTHYYYVDAFYTANHDVSVQQAHGAVLQMKTSSGTGNFALPDAVAGMNLICINSGAGMNFTVATGDSINGTTNGSLTSDITASLGGVRLISFADNYWAAYPLNPLATS